MRYYLKAKKIYHENGILKDKYILIKNGYIKKFIDSSDKNKLDKNLKIIDFENKIVIPALIDMHIHGAVGKDVMDADYNSLNTISEYLAQNGVGRFLATTLTAPLSKIKKALKNVKNAKKNGVKGAKIIGTYLEGPYLSEEKKGAHPKEFLREISIEEIKDLIKTSGGDIKVVAVAPEKKNSQKLIKYLKDKNIISTIAHTNANYSDIKKAEKYGASLVTHVFNGMKGLHHRKPGALGGVLNSEKIYTELIADKIHVHPAVMNILYNIKDPEKIALISDCMRAGGLENGKYKLGELDVEVKNSIARTESGSLAGSTLKIKDAVKNIQEITSSNLATIIKMASLVPAKILGISEKTGSLKVGKKADITIIDSEMNVYATIVEGNIIYKKELI